MEGKEHGGKIPFKRKYVRKNRWNPDRFQQLYRWVYRNRYYYRVIYDGSMSDFKEVVRQNELDPNRCIMGRVVIGSDGLVCMFRGFHLERLFTYDSAVPHLHIAFDGILWDAFNPLSEEFNTPFKCETEVTHDFWFEYMKRGCGMFKGYKAFGEKEE